MRLYAAAIALVALTGYLEAGEPKGALVTPWVKAASSEARLILPAAPGKGESLAGIEIRLPPDSKTYWRTAGETGVPPTFDFSGSTGVGKPAVLFPAPTAFDDGAGGIAYGYIEHVVFPVRLLAGEGAALKATVDYGVCLKNMCVPARVELSGAPGSGTQDAGAAAALAKAHATVPTAVALHADAPRAIHSVSGKVDGDTAMLTIEVTGADTAAQLFLEADDTFALTRNASTGGFTATARRPSGAGAKPWGKALLTLSTSSGAIETPVDLDTILQR